MEYELKVVDIFIGTTLRGSAKGSGRVMYIMRTKRKNGSDYEAAPQIAEYDDTTESASVTRYSYVTWGNPKITKDTGYVW